MTRCSSRRLDQLLLTSALALVLTTLPLGLSTDGPPLDWQIASARGGGNGSGGGGGNGQGGGHGGGRGDHGRDASDRSGPDRGAGARGHALGHAKERGAQAGGARGYHDLNEFVDSVRSGRAVGLGRRDARIDGARGRYRDALGKPDHSRHAGSLDDVGPAAHHFSPEETGALMGRGWKGPDAQAASFRNHGQRVSTMVELSKQLGYGARVGALQANFGTPYENGIATLQDELATARAAGNEAEAERLEAELADAIANAKPGVGPDGSWATADLDVNDDRVVDGRDLEALGRDETSSYTDSEQPAS
jgi:hypothetical protein